MGEYAAFRRLRELNQPVPKPPPLPAEDDLDQAEDALGVSLPPSYRHYLLHYSDVAVGTYEPYGLWPDAPRLDLVPNVREAWEQAGLPRHLLPFLYDNGDYFCFDLSGAGPEYRVVYWSHMGTTDESWDDFPSWVEQCWIGDEVAGGAAPAANGGPATAPPKKPWWRLW